MANSSPFTQTLYTFSAHRHLILAAGVCLLLIGAWCGWQSLSTQPSSASDDGFEELDGFAATNAPQFEVLEPLTAPSQESGALQWGQPELPPSPAQPPAFNMAPQAPSTDAFAPLPSDSASPAWFAGTIEAVDDVPTLPTWIPPEPDLRYSRNAKNSEPTTLR